MLAMRWRIVISGTVRDVFGYKNVLEAQLDAWSQRVAHLTTSEYFHGDESHYVSSRLLLIDCVGTVYARVFWLTESEIA